MRIIAILIFAFTLGCSPCQKQIVSPCDISYNNMNNNSVVYENGGYNKQQREDYSNIEVRCK